MTGLRVDPSLNRYLCPVCDLANGERLIISAFRRWLHDRASLPKIAQRFCQSLGRDKGHRAIEGFCVLFDLLANNARRQISLRYPGSDKVSTDERTLIALVAAAQHNNHDRVAALVRWLLPSAVQGLAVINTLAFAAALKEGGYILAQPSPRRPAEKPGAGLLKAVS